MHEGPYHARLYLPHPSHHAIAQTAQTNNQSCMGRAYTVQCLSIAAPLSGEERLAGPLADATVAVGSLASPADYRYSCVWLATPMVSTTSTGCGSCLDAFPAHCLLNQQIGARVDSLQRRMCVK